MQIRQEKGRREKKCIAEEVMNQMQKKIEQTNVKFSASATLSKIIGQAVLIRKYELYKCVPNS